MPIRHRRGCRAKTHRSLDHGAASKTAQALNAQCARQGKTCEEVEPHRNTRQCVHGASRNTKVTHTIVHCNEWGVSTPRDAGASGNAVLKTIARGLASNRGVASQRAAGAIARHPRVLNPEATGRNGSVLHRQCRLARKKPGLEARALASSGRAEIGRLLIQRLKYAAR